MPLLFFSTRSMLFILEDVGLYFVHVWFNRRRHHMAMGRGVTSELGAA